jgi:hypothetical protein
MRKWMDIINELQLFDPEKLLTTDDGGTLPPLAPQEDGGEPNGKKVHVFDILWDTDEPNLPTEISFPLDDLDDVPWPSEGGGPDGDMMTRVGDWLTHNIHGSLSNFDFYIS